MTSPDAFVTCIAKYNLTVSVSLLDPEFLAKYQQLPCSKEILIHHLPLFVAIMSLLLAYFQERAHTLTLLPPL